MVDLDWMTIDASEFSQKASSDKKKFFKNIVVIWRKYAMGERY